VGSVWIPRLPHFAKRSGGDALDDGKNRQRQQQQQRQRHSVQRKLFGGMGEENYCNQSKDNYRGPSTTPLRGFAQDDGEKQTKATARAKARNKQRQRQEQRRETNKGNGKSKVRSRFLDSALSHPSEQVRSPGTPVSRDARNDAGFGCMGREADSSFAALLRMTGVRDCSLGMMA